MNAYDIFLLVAFFGMIGITAYKSIQIFNYQTTTKETAPKKFFYSLGTFGLSFLLWVLVFSYTVTISISQGSGIINMSVILLMLTSGFLVINLLLTIAENMIYFARGFFSGRGVRSRH